MGQLTNLFAIRIDINSELSGVLPPELGQLSNLVQMSFIGNNLTGSIPVTFGQLEKLERISLQSNNLQGNIPVEMTQLPNLKSLDIRENIFFGNIPSFIGTPLFQIFSIGTNKFRFIDFENEFATYNQELSLSYSPQAKIDIEQTITKQVNESIIFKMFEDNYFSTNNTYQWYKDGVAISGAIGRTYTVNSLAPTDTGDYYCLANNTVVTGLTLEKNPIHLVVENPCGPFPAATEIGYEVSNPTKSLCINEPITFILGNYSSEWLNLNTINNYSWTFHNLDGSTVLSSDATPGYTYTTAGKYIIDLTVTYNDVCTQVFSQTFAITDCEPSCEEVEGNISITTQERRG